MTSWMSRPVTRGESIGWALTVPCLLITATAGLNVRSMIEAYGNFVPGLVTSFRERHLPEAEPALLPLVEAVGSFGVSGFTVLLLACLALPVAVLCTRQRTWIRLVTPVVCTALVISFSSQYNAAVAQLVEAYKALGGPLEGVVPESEFEVLVRHALKGTQDEDEAAAAEPESPAGGERLSHEALFTKLVGRWEGTCRTWFTPDELADESPVSGEFVALLDGRFLRHVYRGSMQGRPRQGEELLGFDPVEQRYQIAWLDDFHMNTALMFSQGPPLPRGFSVRGDYGVSAGEPRWGWRTAYELADDDRLVITAFNIFPDGREVRAVQTEYRRVADTCDDAR